MQKKILTQILPLAALLTLSFSFSNSEARAQEPQKVLLTWEYVDQVSQRFQVPFAVMMLDLHQEKGYVGYLSPANDNGTYDCGPFQVNTCHLADPLFQKLGISKDMLVYNGKANAIAAAYLYRRAYEETGSWWAAVGRYHMPPRTKRSDQSGFLASAPPEVVHEVKNHCIQVAALSSELGRLLGWSSRDINTIEWAGYFHDFGKYLIPPHILIKSGTLTVEEWMHLQSHPHKSRRSLAPLDWQKKVQCSLPMSD